MKRYSIDAYGVYEALSYIRWWMVKMSSRQSCRVFECIVHIAKDKSKVIQVSSCNIAELHGQSKPAWCGKDIESRSIYRRGWAEDSVAKCDRGGCTFDTSGTREELDSE